MIQPCQLTEPHIVAGGDAFRDPDREPADEQPVGRRRLVQRGQVAMLAELREDRTLVRREASHSR